ncbi:MAG: hypothetical protein ABIT08_04525 [Bacteroidia bacterium]
MLRVLEISWLTVFIIGSSFGIYKTVTESFINAVYIFIPTVFALIFYLMRRKQRIALQKQKEE